MALGFGALKSNCAVNYMSKMLKGARGMAFDFAKSEKLAGGGTNWGRMKAIGNRVGADVKANQRWAVPGSLIGAGLGGYGGYKAGGAMTDDSAWGKIGGGILGAGGGFVAGTNIGGSLGPNGMLRNAGKYGYNAAYGAAKPYGRRAWNGARGMFSRGGGTIYWP